MTPILTQKERNWRHVSQNEVALNEKKEKNKEEKGSIKKNNEA